MLNFVPYLENSVKTPVQLNILDLIMIDSITMYAYKWIFTDPNGFVKFRKLKPIPFGDIAKSLLANINPGNSELAEYRRIVII